LLPEIPVRAMARERHRLFIEARRTRERVQPGSLVPLSP
jgi:hypothetical protein